MSKFRDSNNLKRRCVTLSRNHAGARSGSAVELTSSDIINPKSSAETRADVTSRDFPFSFGLFVFAD